MFQIFPKKHRGFTLIEMLVVIAIIGILAGMILVALGGMRAKAKDSRIIAEMGQLRNAAPLYYADNGNSFNGLGCSVANPNISALCTDIAAQGGITPSDEVTPTYGVDIITDNDQVYCAEVKLNSGKYWCVDSQGRSARYDENTLPTTPACATGGPYTCD